MSTENDVARSLGSWLKENRHEDADRILDAVLDQIPATPQRRASWLARRTPTMNNYARLGLVAAAALAVVIVGIGLFGRPSDVGPTTSPTPSESAAALDPLAGLWAASTTTCEQQNAAINAAGFTAEQISLSGWTCPNGESHQFSVQFWTPISDSHMTILDGASQASQTDYRIVDDQTFEAFLPDDPFCIPFRYTIDGNTLTIDVGDSCNATGNPQWNDQVALTAIFETSSFTRQP